MQATATIEVSSDRQVGLVSKGGTRRVSGAVMNREWQLAIIKSSYCDGVGDWLRCQDPLTDTRKVLPERVVHVLLRIACCFERRRFSRTIRGLLSSWLSLTIRGILLRMFSTSDAR